MREPEIDTTWLAPLLEQKLRQVAAPEEILTRVGDPQVPRAWSIFPSLAVLTAVTVVATALWGFFPRLSSSANTQASPAQVFAIQALAGGPERLDFQSGAVPEIRAWVKARTGLEIPLPSMTSNRVRLMGVCAVRGGTPAIEVAYRVSGHRAALLVSKASASTSGCRHQFLTCESTGGARVSTWIMRGQLYTLAYAAPGNLRDECLLCHNTASPAM